MITSVITSLQKKIPSLKTVADCEEALRIKFFRTGCALVDLLLQGGFPLSRITELLGSESTYKSTLAILAAKSYLNDPIHANIPKENVYVVYVDLENTFTIQYANFLGLDTSRVLYVVPENGEQMFDRIFDIGSVDAEDHILYIVDSIAEISTGGELENDVDDYHPMAAQASLVSQGYRRKLMPLLRRHWDHDIPHSTFITINQARDTLNTFQSRFQSIHGPGGHGRKHLSSVLLQLSRTAPIKKKVQHNKVDMMVSYGTGIKFSVEKNKCGGPLVSGEAIYFTKDFEFEGVPYKRGEFNNAHILFSYGVFNDVIRADKRSYYFKDNLLAVGEGATRLQIYRDNDLSQELFAAILTKLTGDTVPEQVTYLPDDGEEDSHAGDNSGKSERTLTFGKRK